MTGARRRRADPFIVFGAHPTVPVPVALAPGVIWTDPGAISFPLRIARPFAIVGSCALMTKGRCTMTPPRDLGRDGHSVRTWPHDRSGQIGPADRYDFAARSAGRIQPQKHEYSDVERPPRHASTRLEDRTVRPTSSRSADLVRSGHDAASTWGDYLAFSREVDRTHGLLVPYGELPGVRLADVFLLGGWQETMLARHPKGWSEVTRGTGGVCEGRGAPPFPPCRPGDDR